ncbi:MAG: hypothetical protein GY757_09950 [bacterium]|nr:hypothetical protein [bacterium]
MKTANIGCYQPCNRCGASNEFTVFFGLSLKVDENQILGGAHRLCRKCAEELSGKLNDTYLALVNPEDKK